MKEFARPIFEDNNHSLAKQVLNIAIIEGCVPGEYKWRRKGDELFYYFSQNSNFELTIKLTDAFTFANAREYFDSLALKIETENLTQIYFKERNDFFLPDEEKGFEPHQENKRWSDFSYRLKLPAAQAKVNNDKLQTEFNPLDLTPLRIKPFKYVDWRGTGF